MANRRSQFKEKPVAWLVRDARLGSLGLDFSDVPADVAAAPEAAAEWARLAEEFKSEPVRFREGDRASVAAYVIAWAIYSRAASALLTEGLTVQGRSAPDRGRVVKSPNLAVWTQASTQLQRWAKECCLTPDSRLRAGLADSPMTEEERDVFGDGLLD